MLWVECIFKRVKKRKKKPTRFRHSRSFLKYFVVKCLNKSRLIILVVISCFCVSFSESTVPRRNILSLRDAGRIIRRRNIHRNVPIIRKCSMFIFGPDNA